MGQVKAIRNVRKKRPLLTLLGVLCQQTEPSTRKLPHGQVNCLSYYLIGYGPSHSQELGNTSILIG